MCSLFSLELPWVVTPDPTRSPEHLWQPSDICLTVEDTRSRSGLPPFIRHRIRLHWKETSFPSVQTQTGRTGISCGWDLRAETFLGQAPPLPVSVNILKDTVSGPRLFLYTSVCALVATLVMKFKIKDCWCCMWTKEWGVQGESVSAQMVEGTKRYNLMWDGRMWAIIQLPPPNLHTHSSLLLLLLLLCQLTHQSVWN